MGASPPNPLTGGVRVCCHEDRSAEVSQADCPLLFALQGTWFVPALCVWVCPAWGAECCFSWSRAPWALGGHPGACWQQSWHKNAVTRPTHTPINNRQEAAAFLPQEMDSAVQVCHSSAARFVLKYLVVKNTRPALAIRTFCLSLVFSAWSQTPLTLKV